MIEETLQVEITEGLQARPAASFVQKANQFQAHVFLEKDGKRVNAKSIMGVMSLAIMAGVSIKLIAEGSDETEAINQLIHFLQQKAKSL